MPASKGWLLDLNAFLTPSRRRISTRTRSAPRGGPTPMTAASGACRSIPRRRPPPGVPTCSSAMASRCRNRSTICRRSPDRAAAHRALDRLAVGADRPHVHAGVDRREHGAASPGTPTATFCRRADAETRRRAAQGAGAAGASQIEGMEPDPLPRPHGGERRRRLRALPLQLRELFVRRPGAARSPSAHRPPLRRACRRARCSAAPASASAPSRPTRRRRSTTRCTSARRPTSRATTSTYGGQPGSRTAWQSDACNALTGGFFRNTLPVMDQAYLRPTHAGLRSVLPRCDAEARGGRVRGRAGRGRSPIGSTPATTASGRRRSTMTTPAEPAADEDDGRGRQAQLLGAGRREGARRPRVHGQPARRA